MMDRRTFMKSAPTVALVGVLPAHMSDIQIAYLDWVKARDAADNFDGDNESEKYAVLMDRFETAQKSMRTLPSSSVHDLALKIVAADHDGDMNNSEQQIALAKEARKIIGATS